MALDLNLVNQDKNYDNTLIALCILQPAVIRLTDRRYAGTYRRPPIQRPINGATEV